VHLEGVEEMRKVSIHTVEGDIGLARNVANGTTKFPFLEHCAGQMERMLEEIKEARNKKEVNEPNAFINKEDGLVCAKCFKPFTEEWQYLTDEEIKEIVGSYGSGLGAYVRELFDKIEAKIKEKNV
jgi:hypothetical protein